LPIPFAWLVAFAFGAAFARLARGEIMRSDVPLIASQPMAVVLGFAGLVVIPVTGYFAAFHGDWAYLYWVPWQQVPSAIDLAAVVLAGAMVPAGFVAGVAALRTGQTRAAQLLVALVGAPLAVVVALAVACESRLAVSASAAQYRGGFGVEPIASSALGKGVLLALLALGAGGAWAVRALRRA
jgi:hypothetical protein